MFNPESFGNYAKVGFQEMVYQSIMKCDLDVRKDLYLNILLSGGSTMFPGTLQRLTKELEKLVPSGTQMHVLGLSERNVLTWIGGSILSSLATFTAMWISKAEFADAGVSTVHKKCF
jgi:actin-related protein